MNPLDLSVEDRERLKAFQDSGLLWLVNTTVLHPRGFALALHYDDEDGLPRGLSVVGDGSEPWCFAIGEQNDLLAEYEKAEAERERLWSAKLRTKPSP